MKKILIALFLCLILCVNAKSDEMSGDAFFAGTHPLYPLKQLNNVSTDCLKYFWISETSQGQQITFVWKNQAIKEYLVFSIPISLIRIRVDEKANFPTVNFRWRGGMWVQWSSTTMDALIREQIIYVVITTNKKDSLLDLEDIKLEK